MRKSSIKILRKIKHTAKKVLRIPRLLVAVAQLLMSRVFADRSRPKAVGLLVDSFNRGGLEQVVLNLYKGYREHGIPSYILSVTNQVSDMIQDIEDDPRHLRILHWNLIDLVDFCRKNNIRTLHYHYSIYHMPIMRLLGIKTIYTIHNTYVWFSPGAWKKTKLYLFFCSHIVAVSDFARDYFIEKTGIRRVVTVLNGIDIDHFTNDMKRHAKTITRKTLGLGESDIVFVNVASFNEQKYQLSLVGAMEKIIKQRKDIKLVLVGPVGDEKLFKYITKVIQKSPARKYIQLHDPLSQPELASFLKTVPNAFILPSIYEAGVPLVVSEALLCGLPVAMTDLHAKSYPFSQFITTIQPPYESLAQLSIKDVTRMVRRKNSVNQADIIRKMLQVADNLESLKPRIGKDEALRELGIERMTKAYIDLIEK